MATTTPNLGLYKPARGDVDWDTEVNLNQDRIDALFVARADILWVAVDGDDTDGDGTFNLPYATIAKAITEAAAGDTIMLFPGTHDQSAATLSFAKIVHLKGFGVRESVIITGTAASILESYPGMTIENLTIQATGTESDSFVVQLTGTVLRSVNVEDASAGSGAKGIYIPYGPGTVVEDCNIIADDGYAIYLFLAAPGDAGAVIFRRVHAVSADDVCVAIAGADSDDALFEHCYIESGGADTDYGIEFAHAVTGTVIRYCTIKGETAGGGEESIHVAAAMNLAVYLCALNAIIDATATNDVATPYNVVDADI